MSNTIAVVIVVIIIIPGVAETALTDGSAHIAFRISLTGRDIHHDDYCYH